MALDRSGARDVHIFNANDRLNPQKVVLGGLILSPGVRRFEITPNRSALRPYSSSSSASARRQSFKNAVRARDKGCVVTGLGTIAARFGSWTTLQAAHVYPLSLRSSWNMHNFGVSDINSVQNGILFDASVHLHWDAYNFSIDVKDKYKIVGFGPQMDHFTGGYLHEDFLQHLDRPPDKLLEWHFTQAVLANVKGAGECVLDFDFPPSSDMLGEIRKGPMAVERMEMELFSRLADDSVTFK